MTSVDLSTGQLAELETFAIELARAAGAAILPLFRTENGLQDKGGPRGFDPVTAADKGAEAAMRQAIAARYPSHGVLGEEYGDDRSDAEFVWVLDPIDGTRAFISGLPVWTTLIGLRFQGRPIVGAINQPYVDELYVGTALGSRLIRSGETRTLMTRPCPRLSQAIIATTDPALFNDAERRAWEAVRAAARLARLGCDAYAYAMVAAGMIDLVLEAGLKPWDIEAAVALIEGAGGLVTDWRGDAIGTRGGQLAIAGDRAMLDEALERLRPAAA